MELPHEVGGGMRRRAERETVLNSAGGPAQRALQVNATRVAPGHSSKRLQCAVPIFKASALLQRRLQIEQRQSDLSGLQPEAA